MNISRSIAVVLLVTSFLKQTAFGAQVTPCDNLPGNWEGTWFKTNGTCIWNVVSEVFFKGENVRMLMKYKEASRKANNTACPEGLAILYGSCKNSKLDLKVEYFQKFGQGTVTGQIIDNQLSLQNDSTRAVLYKK